jgi:hypothetical protein
MVAVTDNTYSVAQLCAQERHLLRLLGYDLSTPTSARFLSAFIQLAGVGGREGLGGEGRVKGRRTTSSAAYTSGWFLFLTSGMPFARPHAQVILPSSQQRVCF